MKLIRCENTALVLCVAWLYGGKKKREEENTIRIVKDGNCI